MEQVSFRTVDEYIDTFPEDVQAVLRTVRRTIRAAAPDAEERIGYRMPAYALHRPLLYFAAWKRHYALYPAGASLDELAEGRSTYAVSKGAIKFRCDEPVPVRLIDAIARQRAAANLRAQAERG